MRFLSLAAILTAAFCLWHGAARAADAKDTPITHDPWIVQRQIYLRNVVDAGDHAYPERGAAYLEGIKDNTQQWWDRWLSDIPYDRGLSYTTPSAEMIGTVPGLIPPAGMAAQPPDLSAAQAPADDSGAAGQSLPHGPSDANRSTAPIEPLPADKIFGR